MSSNGRKENILTSWKEIAAYLGRDVRTCVRWEQRYGLPVHRLERDSRAKVFAYKDQVDEWLAERAESAGVESHGRSIIKFLFRPLPLLVELVGCIVAAYWIFFRPAAATAPRDPADFHIRGSAFVALDGAGRELWSFDTRLPDLETEDVYHGHFQVKRSGEDSVPVLPYVRIGDLDGDRRPEVLFCIQTRSEVREGTLICFDAGGAERWRFEAGRALEIGGRTFRREYRIFGFDVADFDGDGAPEILVLSFHKPDWPCQAVLLNASGTLKGEYWNAGYLMDGGAGDVDGDGVTELVLSGVNNEYRRGCLAVFKPGGLRGASPQEEGEFRFPFPEEGQQSAYILFPKSEVHAAIQAEGDPVNYFWIHDGGGLTAVTTGTLIYFDLDRRLVCRDVTLSNTFRNLYAELVRKGVALPAPDDRYRKGLEAALLYYDRGRWLSAPPAFESRSIDGH